MNDKRKEWLHSILLSINEAVIVVDAHGKVDLLNPLAEVLTGWKLDEVLGKELVDFFHVINKDTRVEVENLATSVLREGMALVLGDHLLLIRRDGTERQISGNCMPVGNDTGEITGAVLLIHDERTAIEEGLRESEGRLRRAELLAHVGHYAFDGDGGNPTWSAGLKKIWGIDINTNPSFSDLALMLHPDDRDWVLAEQKKATEEMRQFDLEYRIMRPDGTDATVRSYGEFTPAELGGIPRFFGTLIDITDQKRAEKEKADLENQLQHAQRTESIGRLAGGIAHDFNNMLGVILGYADLALEKVASTKPLRSDLIEIRNAALRSANLTRQLLAFARKQVASPKILNLNDVIGDMLKMLQRLIGEDINLIWLPGDNLGLVKMDPAQVDQILANLCVNARDAISGVGKITIETNNVTFDEAYCAEHPGFLPGSYIMLALSDNGMGMDQETQANIFEPYFSTKEAGKGTGLGLSTVYGIVKQNEGFINVYSESGQGTTFKIYLSRLMAEGKASVITTFDQVARGGSETILLVEDESVILDLGRRLLESLGYHVLAANSPTDALILAKEHPETIDLLITDVVMPEMNGRELAEQLNVIIPDLKILYMSGYTANVIAHHGVLDEGVMLISKPFSKNELAIKVREAITMKIPG